MSSSSTVTGEEEEGAGFTGTFKHCPQWLSVETMSLFHRIQNFWF